ncbi:MAG: DUF1849 family protein [Hyphomicrobiales bacterium]|nr:MAG: DUF1849 family protein [Hyphomicrobiales bacterium]
MDHRAQGDASFMRRIALTMFLALTATAAQAGSIAPHRAVYDLSLLRVSEGAGLTTAEGRLAFEVQGSTCEGWTVNFRMANRFSPSDGEVKMVDTQSTAYESGDYLEMHYNQKEFVNGALREEAASRSTDRRWVPKEVESAVQRERSRLPSPQRPSSRPSISSSSWKWRNGAKRVIPA